MERAWRITWKNRALWVFGFLLALFSAGGGGNAATRSTQYTGRPELDVAPGVVVGLVLVGLAIFLIVALVGTVLRYLSEGALIGMVREVEDVGTTTVRSGWWFGWSRFLRLFAIDLVIGIPAVVVSLLMLALGGLPLLLLVAEKDVLTAVGILGTIGLELLMIGAIVVLGTTLSVLRLFAFRRCALAGTGVWASVRDSYHLLRQNARHVAVMWLAMLGIGLAVGLVAMPVTLVTAALVAGPAVGIYAVTEAAGLAILVALVLGLVAAVLFAAVMSVYQVFRSAVWTLTYTELVPEGYPVA
jgi:hypothetical protein